jgi:hypothetical protein
MSVQLSNKNPVDVTSDPEALLRYGVCKVRIPTDRVAADEWQRWAETLSQATPEIMAGEGDGEYVFYRNILEEPGFPFDEIIQSSIGDAIVKHFGLRTLDEIRLDDAFCIHYNTDQADTSGAKHTDPSDITVNMCLEKSDDTEGSHVLFHGTKSLTNVPEASSSNSSPPPGTFLVRQDAGYATIHWGDHLHETMPLKSGRRTNVVLTFWYKDASRSDVASRTCYG